MKTTLLYIKIPNGYKCELTQCTLHNTLLVFFFHCDVLDRPSNIELSFIHVRPALPINYMLNMTAKNSFYVSIQDQTIVSTYNSRYSNVYIYIQYTYVYYLLGCLQTLFYSPYFNELAEENFWHFIVTKEIYML